MASEVRFPVVGESVQEGQVYKWRKKSGEIVKRDDVLVEIETDKATVEIVAEAEGVITVLKQEGDTVAVGEVLAKIDSSAAVGAPSVQDVAKKTPEIPLPQHSSDAQVALEPGPAVNRLVAEHKVDTSSVSGTGRGGRLTKGDVLAHVEASQQKAEPLAKPGEPKNLPLSTTSTATTEGQRGIRREKMTRIRQRIAERLVEAQHNAAMLTTFNEVDMSATMDLRKRYKDTFKDVHGANLGFMSFFVKAAVEALKAFPAINGYVDGSEIVYHDYYDIGVAVSTERGLMVPVVRDCDKLSFAGVESTIAEFAKKGREGKIGLDDLSGGTFTISNGGVFGSLLSTPILNPPQSAILGMHKIQERPVVVNGQIVIRPMMYLAMSYDHRIVDGKEAVSFLVKIKDAIEDPARLLLGV